MQSVLVVDADRDVRAVAELVLALEGFTVHTADSLDAALAITRSQQVDVVTIDLMLPGVTGWQLSAQLREEPTSAHCRQVIVSESAIADDVMDAPLLADAVMHKPFDFATFTSVLRGLLDQPTEPDRKHPLSDALHDVLQHRLVFPLYQPIVDLSTRQVLGVEALARGPQGRLHLPLALFDVAHQTGHLYELDSLCRLRAISGAVEAGPLVPPLVFVNLEPGTVEVPSSPELTALLQQGQDFTLVIEFTERALTKRLPALLRHAAEIRAGGNLVALDDMGIDPRAVAMLPLLQPEVIKLDMSLLAPGLTPTAAKTAVAVAAYAERTGACVIAEGIETEQQYATALALGADWGQGYLFARPGALAALEGMDVQRTRPSTVAPRPVAAAGVTPFDLASKDRVVRQGDPYLLDGISQHLEARAAALGDLGIMVVALQDVRHLDGVRDRGYAELARRIAFMGFLGRGVPAEPLPGAYGVDLVPGEALCREWTLAVLGPHDATVLCARERDGGQTRGDREFDFVLSHDRELAEDVARLLVVRFEPRDAIPRTTAVPLPPADRPVRSA